MTHILARHHPDHFAWEVLQKNDFFRKGETVEDIASYIELAVRKSGKALKQNGGTNAFFSHEVWVGPRKFVIGFDHGKVGQFYPLNH